ncbi:hypothetical protein ABTM93_19690, partial [Acinetobacter baumannii]
WKAGVFEQMLPLNTEPKASTSNLSSNRDELSHSKTGRVIWEEKEYFNIIEPPQPDPPLDGMDNAQSETQERRGRRPKASDSIVKTL